MKIKLPVVILPILLLCIIACNKAKPSGQKGEIQDPIQFLSKEIQSAPKDTELLFQRSKLYAQSNQLDLAFADIQKAISIDSTVSKYYIKLSDLHIQNNASREAVEVLEDYLYRFKDNKDVLLQLAQVYYLLQQYQKSLTTLNQIFYYQTQDAQTFLLLGLNLRALDDNDRAMEALKQAVDRDPDITDAWIALGELAMKQGDPVAKTYYDNAVRIDPDNPFANHSLAFYLQNNGDIPGAIALYQMITKKTPEYLDAYMNMGVLYTQIDSFTRAEEQFEAAIKLSSGNYRAHYYRGLVRETLGNEVGARSDFKTAIGLNPNYDEAKEAYRRLTKSES